MISYGLCGRVLKHSYSKIIHEILGNKEYELYSLERDELYELFESRGFKGLNITIPYKTDAYKLCDEVSENARRIGSVNTVVNKNGTIYGYNTDYDGFVYLLKRSGIDIKGKKVLILGSGGTSLTVRAVCEGEGAGEYTVISRSGENNYGNISKHYDADVIVNTTPVGMYPDNGRKPIELSGFKKLCGVVDVVYNPIKTALVREALEMNIPATTGLPMLAAQAVKAHDLFFGTKTPDSVTEKVIADCLMQILNVVFVGMPGCGKTTVGREYAKLSGRSFLDTDDFVEQCGVSIPEIFEKYGEEYFRNKETQAIEMLSALSGKVIATGGGAVKRKENVSLMKQNGVVVYLQRELDELAVEGRPLSDGGRERITALYAERRELYENAADVTVKTDGDAKKCAEKLVSELEKTIPKLF